MKVVEFSEGHLDLLNDDIVLKSGVSLDVLREYAQNRGDDVMLTFVDDDRIVCISGIITLWDGVGDVFNLRTKYLKTLHARRIKEEFDVRVQFFDRLQTYSESGTFDRWHELMGFYKEGTLKKYRDGKDYILWARLNGN